MKGLGYVRAKLDRAQLRLHNATRITRTYTIGDTPMVVEAGNPRELSRIKAYVRKEPDTVEWINSHVRPNDVFYDIGANIGLYSILAARRLAGLGKVYSFEPESQNYASLNKNVYLNGLSDSIVTLCVAVSDARTIDTFHVRGQLRAGEAIHQFRQAEDDFGRPFTPVHQQGMFGITLDDLCYSYDLDFPSHIKIDVDGHEYAVVTGARRVLADPRLQSVLLEITEKPNERDQIRFMFSAFQEAGFSVSKKMETAPERDAHNVIFTKAAP
jgi:FkbM family methyltransferase